MQLGSMEGVAAAEIIDTSTPSRIDFGLSPTVAKLRVASSAVSELSASGRCSLW